MNIYKKWVIIFLILSIYSCAGYQGNNVKLNEYKQVDQEDIKDLDLSYFNSWKTVKYELKSKGLKKYDSEKNPTKCDVVAFVTSTNTFFSCPIFTNIPALFTGTAVIPYYCAQIYKGHGSLIARDPSDSNKYRNLADYYLEDKVHEVWSLWQIVLATLIPPMRKIDDPDVAKHKLYRKVSKALALEILNDALNHKECYKNEKDYYEYQKRKTLNDPKKK